MPKSYLALKVFLLGALLRVYDEHLRRRTRKLEGSFNSIESAKLVKLSSGLPWHYNWMLFALLYVWPEQAVRIARRKLQAPKS